MAAMKMTSNMGRQLEMVMKKMSMKTEMKT